MNGMALPASASRPRSASPGSPSDGYGSPRKFGLRSSTMRAFGSFCDSMNGPVPTGHQSRVKFFSAMPGWLKNLSASQGIGAKKGIASQYTNCG